MQWLIAIFPAWLSSGGTARAEAAQVRLMVSAALGAAIGRIVLTFKYNKYGNTLLTERAGSG